MTAGERMIWAAVFAERRGYGKSVAEAARLAALEVKNLRSLAIHHDLLAGDEDAREILRDLIGVPR